MEVWCKYAEGISNVDCKFLRHMSILCLDEVCRHDAGGIHPMLITKYSVGRRKSKWAPWMWWDVCELVRVGRREMREGPCICGWEEREKRGTCMWLAKCMSELRQNSLMFVSIIPEFGRPNSFTDRYRSPLNCKKNCLDTTCGNFAGLVEEALISYNQSCY